MPIFSLADLQGFSKLDAKQRKFFLALCEKIETHVETARKEAEQDAIREAAQERKVRSEEGGERKAVQRLRNLGTGRASKPRGKNTTVGEAAAGLINLQVIHGDKLPNDPRREVSDVEEAKQVGNEPL